MISLMCGIKKTIHKTITHINREKKGGIFLKKKKQRKWVDHGCYCWMGTVSVMLVKKSSGDGQWW